MSMHREVHAVAAFGPLNEWTNLNLSITDIALQSGNLESCNGRNYEKQSHRLENNHIMLRWFQVHTISVTSNLIYPHSTHAFGSSRHHRAKCGSKYHRQQLPILQQWWWWWWRMPNIATGMQLKPKPMPSSSGYKWLQEMMVAWTRLLLTTPRYCSPLNCIYSS